MSNTELGGAEGPGATGEMIFSGDELLRGDTLNTNQSYLGERLLDLGIFATHALCVTDDLAAMVEAIKASLARRPAVLVLSGGLGPTEDDLTREAAAEALGRPLEHREDLLELIRARFDSRGWVMSESNRKQALIPRGASSIPLTGTAPGFHVRQGETLVVALPGVPWELKQMWEGTVEPLLRGSEAESGPDGRGSHVPTGRVLRAQDIRRIRTFGIGESVLAEMLSEFDWHDPEATIGTRANLDGVTVILRGLASAGGGGRLEAVRNRVLALLGERVYGADGDSLPEVTGALLRKARLTVAVAESCTGGLIAKRFTDVPGSSDYFLGGVVAYDNRVKTELLGVPADVLAAKGAVSAEVAAAMAEGACRRLGADCALSSTGLAGPGGGSEEKPVGLAFIGCTIKGVTVVERLHSPGQREQIRERSAFAALDLLRRQLLDLTRG